MLISRFPPHIGGAELQCQRLSKRLVERGHHVTVVTETPQSHLPRDSFENGIHIVRLHNNAPGPLASFLSFLNFFIYSVRHPDADVLHAHLLSANAVAAIVAGRCLSKSVLVKIAGARRTGDLATSKQSNLGRFKLWLARWAQVPLVCPAPETAEEAISITGLRDLIHEIPNGVDETLFKPLGSDDKKHLRTSLSLENKKYWAVYAGRWAPGKGVENLIELWEQGAREKVFDWGLLLILPQATDIPETYKKRLEKLGGSLRVLHNPSNLVSYYQASDLAVLLSRGEGLSNFLLEAMACGLPTYVTEAAAVHRSEAERWGWMTREPSVSEGVALFQKLQEDPSLLDAKSAAARKEIEANYSLSIVASRYEDLYKELSHVRNLRRH